MDLTLFFTCELPVPRKKNDVTVRTPGRQDLGILLGFFQEAAILSSEILVNANVGSLKLPSVGDQQLPSTV